MRHTHFTLWSDAYDKAEKHLFYDIIAAFWIFKLKNNHCFDFALIYMYNIKPDLWFWLWCRFFFLLCYSCCLLLFVMKCSSLDTWNRHYDFEFELMADLKLDRIQSENIRIYSFKWKLRSSLFSNWPLGMGFDESAWFMARSNFIYQTSEFDISILIYAIRNFRRWMP